MEIFPALLIGGPPNSGKSVLSYNLTQTLRERGVQHYLLRAAPDGEGDWASEADERLMRTILIPKAWTPAFVEHVCESLAGRPLPLIVDVGGLPKVWQECIFDYCTHAVLLTPGEPAHTTWSDLIKRHNLILVADLRSELEGVDQVINTQPLEGVIAGLEWGRCIGGITFDALAERIARLFALDAEQLRRSHLSSAPVETVIDLDRLAGTLGISFTGDKVVWQPHQLPDVLNYLPEATPVGLYGRGPNWLYTAVALLAYPEPFYQFDARLGWVAPPVLDLGVPPADSPLEVRLQPRSDHVHLAFAITKAHLDYTQTGGLVTPRVAPDQGLVLSGKLPLWLYTALAFVYTAHVSPPWLAVYQPQCEGRAVVVSSRGAELSVGDLVESPPPKPSAT